MNKLMAAILLAAALAACGGGHQFSSDDAPDTPTPRVFCEKNPASCR